MASTIFTTENAAEPSFQTLWQIDNKKRMKFAGKIREREKNKAKRTFCSLLQMWVLYVAGWRYRQKDGGIENTESTKKKQCALKAHTHREKCKQKRHRMELKYMQKEWVFFPSKHIRAIWELQLLVMAIVWWLRVYFFFGCDVNVK